MGYDPETQRLHELTPDFFAELTASQRAKVEKQWALFSEGDIVQVRPQTELGNGFRPAFKIAEISHNRMVLIALGAP